MRPLVLCSCKRCVSDLGSWPRMYMCVYIYIYIHTHSACTHHKRPYVDIYGVSMCSASLPPAAVTLPSIDVLSPPQPPRFLGAWGDLQDTSEQRGHGDRWDTTPRVLELCQAPLHKHPRTEVTPHQAQPQGQAG